MDKSRSWKEMADGMGVYFDREINNRLRGVSRMASLNIILERIGLANYFNAISDGNNISRSKPDPEVF